MGERQMRTTVCPRCGRRHQVDAKSGNSYCSDICRREQEHIYAERESVERMAEEETYREKQRKKMKRNGQ